MVTDAAGIPSQASCPPPSTQFFPPSVVKMGPLRAFNFLLTFLVFAAPLTLASAQDTPILEPPREARVTDGQSLHDNVLLIPLYAQLAENRIDGLLVLSKLWSRQQNSVSCATNYTVCQGTQVCCPDGNVCCSSGTCCGAGTYCATVGGAQGCCKLGHICNQVTNQCTVAGQQRCPNENFCCPAGNTCYRDSNNNPRCSSVVLSSSSSTTTSTPTSAISSISSKPNQTGTVTTPTPTRAPLQTFCQLKSSKPQGLFSRRRHAPAHPGPKRRRWF